TPWHNDPVTDPPCDVIYLRDEATGEAWSATPAPIPGDGVHQVRHAPGCSSYTREQGEITTELTMGMPTDDAVKLSLLKITNRGDRPRRISLTCYAEWVLGVRREITVPHTLTWFDPATGAVMARNRFDAAFGERVAFLAMSETA